MNGSCVAQHDTQRSHFCRPVCKAMQHCTAPKYDVVYFSAGFSGNSKRTDFVIPHHTVLHKDIAAAHRRRRFHCFDTDCVISGADVAARNLRAGTIDQVDPVTVLTVAENYQIFHRDILTAEKCRCPVCGPQQHRTIHRYSSAPGETECAACMPFQFGKVNNSTAKHLDILAVLRPDKILIIGDAGPVPCHRRRFFFSRLHCFENCSGSKIQGLSGMQLQRRYPVQSRPEP